MSVWNIVFNWEINLLKIGLQIPLYAIHAKFYQTQPLSPSFVSHVRLLVVTKTISLAIKQNTHDLFRGCLFVRNHVCLRAGCSQGNRWKRHNRKLPERRYVDLYVLTRPEVPGYGNYQDDLLWQWRMGASTWALWTYVCPSFIERLTEGRLLHSGVSQIQMYTLVYVTLGRTAEKGPMWLANIDLGIIHYDVQVRWNIPPRRISVHVYL